MKEFWFTPKNYGNGFYPSSWQGWLIILIALALICGAFYLSNPFDYKTTEQTIKDWLRFIISLVSIFLSMRVYIPLRQCHCTLTVD